MKKPVTVGHRTRDPSACSAVTQPTELAGIRTLPPSLCELVQGSIPCSTRDGSVCSIQPNPVITTSMYATSRQ